MNAAYNYPARVQTRCPWDLSFDASFIYWQPLEDNLEFAIVDNTTLSGPDLVEDSIDANVVDMDFNYKPGFKIGFGGYFDYDNWDVHAEYTWFHTKNHNSASVADTSTAATTTQKILPLWGVPGENTSATPDMLDAEMFFNSADAKWKMNMDIVDLDLGRWCYVGTKLTVRPNFGARAAFIRQHYHVTYEAQSFDSDAADSREVNVFANTHNWGVGVKTGLDTNWMIGQGFRMFGCSEADILFTRYTKLSSAETAVALASATEGATGFPAIHVHQSKHNTVRTHFDIQLGFGWGTYWDCNNWYTDVMLGYEFQVFFDQNMFRHFDDDVMQLNSTMPNGNLYTQGLTAQFSLTF
ncbi:MAG TPA: Lpg1974 family pore-forming outer membrane protein [Chlamydiales bacterium]|nr:Lpg1974 family pore-forming outer membrane protein [Chlamydiales bacterium]